MSAVNRLSLVEQSQHNESADEVKATLHGLIESQEIKLRDIQKFTGFSTATLSQALSGNYEGDVEKLEDALLRYYRNWIANNAIVETSVVKNIHATMMLAWKRFSICRITGKFGAGKSKAASRFVVTHSEFSVYVELTSTTSPSSLINRVAEALNIESQMSGSQDDRLFAIIRALQRKPRLLVIDEADNLKPRTLAILKDIHGGDATQRCAIVLIGTDRLKKVLLDPELGYLQSRIQIKQQVGDIAFDEAKKIADMWPHKLDRDELKEVWAWALKAHGIRSLVALMARSYDAMQMSDKKKIDSDALEQGYGWLTD